MHIKSKNNQKFICAVTLPYQIRQEVYEAMKIRLLINKRKKLKKLISKLPFN